MPRADRGARNVNTKVRDLVADLESAVADAELIVDQHLLDRIANLNQVFATLHRQGPQRLRQARSATSRRRAKRDAS
ncbi:MAG: hypothetical protein OXC12_01380 [Spirochaetaceae bacterium]|nr:hypothetical protein [Spirochaetaceae bacterium]